MAKEHIEREVAIQSLKYTMRKINANVKSAIYDIAIESAIDCLRCVSAADVVEVRHGVWIRHKENCLYNKCSVCSYEHCREDNYCPNCGADMRRIEKR